MPGTAIPGLVVHLIVSADPEDVEAVALPSDDRRRTVERSAQALPVRE